MALAATFSTSPTSCLTLVPKMLWPLERVIVPEMSAAPVISLGSEVAVTLLPATMLLEMSKLDGL